MDQIVCVAPESFETELETELRLSGATVEMRERLAIATNVPPSSAAAWAQNVWRNPIRIEFTSITDAAKKLRGLHPYWSLHSTVFHRRAQLIQDQLPKIKNPPIDFLGTLPAKTLGSWTLLDENSLLAATDCTSVFPDGEVTFNEDKEAPSRAYMKLWELFTVEGVRPAPGARCLDMGASPGGWTWVLAKMGCEVIAVDRASLAPAVSKLKNVKTLQRNAFTLKPEDVGPIDWFFSDLICYPKDLYDLVNKWRSSGLVKNFVCTLKFQGETDHASAREFAKITGSRLKHLSVNKHELTWWYQA